MKLSASATARRVCGALAACAFGGVAAAAIAMPAANAQPSPCSASGLATTASGVLNAAGGYLASHPGANDVLTAAAEMPAAEAESSVRGYFLAHPNEYLDLRNILNPMSELRNQCGISVSPSQLALLFEELS